MAPIDMREQGSNEDEEGKEVLDNEEVEQEAEETAEDSSTSEKSDDESEDISEETDETTPDEEDEESEPSNSEEEVVDDKVEFDVNGLLSEKDKILQEITELRKVRRGLKEQPEVPLMVDRPVDDELADIAPQDVALIEKVLKAKGYVQSSEIQAMSYKDKVNSLKDQWLDKHPEYKPENDPDDKNWNALQAELNQFKTPTRPEDIITLLDKADSFVKPKKSLPIKSSAAITASQEKIKASSKGTSSGSITKTSKPESALKNFKGSLKGFTDEELDEILS